jgi:putative PIN family toxin of toxin-antitoxin system
VVVVLDTNVLVSAPLSPSGPPAEVIDRWEAEQFEVVTSPALLGDLERALQYSRVKKVLQRLRAEVAALIRQFNRVAIISEPDLPLQVIEEDPAENRVLECAAAGGPSYIVSGNDHLLLLKEYEEIVILSPAGFLTLLDLR